jgi:hypothetical protein
MNVDRHTVCTLSVLTGRKEAAAQQIWRFGDKPIGGTVEATWDPCHYRAEHRARPGAKPLSLLGALLIAVSCLFAMASTSRAEADVGPLGPPPAEPDIRAALTGYFTAGHPLGSVVDVQFNGPIIVGPATEHANPPLGPWCVRCGQPDQGISLMYPVKALVTVTATQDLHTSALAGAAANTATYNGTTCPGFTKSQFCPAFYFYRDAQGNWQVV